MTVSGRAVADALSVDDVLSRPKDELIAVLQIRSKNIKVSRLVGHVLLVAS